MEEDQRESAVLGCGSCEPLTACKTLLSQTATCFAPHVLLLHLCWLVSRKPLFLALRQAFLLRTNNLSPFLETKLCLSPFFLLNWLASLSGKQLRCRCEQESHSTFYRTFGKMIHLQRVWEHFRVLSKTINDEQSLMCCHSLGCVPGMCSAHSYCYSLPSFSQGRCISVGSWD